MVATEGLGLANCQAIVSPKSGGAHAARVPRSISSTILFLLLGGGGAAGLVKLAGDRGGLQPGEMAQGYPDINGEGVSPAAQMAASDEDASSINDAGPNKPAPPTIYAPVLVPQPLLQAPCGANCASSDINDKGICATTTWPCAVYLLGQTVNAGLRPAPPRIVYASVLDYYSLAPCGPGSVSEVRAWTVLPPLGRGDARARCMPQSARFLVPSSEHAELAGLRAHA